MPAGFPAGKVCADGAILCVYLQHGEGKAGNAVGRNESSVIQNDEFRMTGPSQTDGLASLIFDTGSL